jgi:hypothetical protein
MLQFRCLLATHVNSHRAITAPAAVPIGLFILADKKCLTKSPISRPLWVVIIGERENGNNATIDVPRADHDQFAKRHTLRHPRP